MTLAGLTDMMIQSSKLKGQPVLDGRLALSVTYFESCSLTKRETCRRSGRARCTACHGRRRTCCPRARSPSEGRPGSLRPAGQDDQVKVGEHVNVVAIGLGSGLEVNTALPGSLGQRVGEQARGTAAWQSTSTRLPLRSLAVAASVAGAAEAAGASAFTASAAAPAATLLASALPWKASLSLAAFSAFLAASSSWEISASSVHFWAS